MCCSISIHWHDRFLSSHRIFTKYIIEIRWRVLGYTAPYPGQQWMALGYNCIFCFNNHCYCIIFLPPRKFFMLYCCLLIFFSKSTFSKNSFRNTIWMSNWLDPDQARRFVGSELGPLCCKGYQQTTLGGNELKPCLWRAHKIYLCLSIRILYRPWWEATFWGISSSFTVNKSIYISGFLLKDIQIQLQ